MMDTANRKRMRCLALILLWSLSVGTAFAGSFEGLTPGVSTRGEVYQTLGSPLKKTRNARKCWFDPAPFEGKRIQAKFFDSGILRTLTLEPGQAYSLAQYEAWLGLGKPDREEVQDGRQFHYYDSRGVALVQEGLAVDAPVAYFWHYDTGINKLHKRWEAIRKDCTKARKQDDCDAMERAWRSGRREFPKIAAFINHQIYWLMTCVGRPGSDRSELLALAEKAIALNPADTEFINLGWIYYSLYEDWPKALSAFSEVNLEANPEIHYFLGDCLEKTGGPAREIRKHYRDCAEKDPDSKWGKKARQRLARM